MNEQLSPKAIKAKEDSLATKKRTEAMKANHEAVQRQVEAMEPEARTRVREAQATVNLEIEKINGEVFDFERENRLRKQGMSPGRAEELALKLKEVKIGQLFQFYGETKVVTPFKTVVTGQEYVTFLQERILDNPQFKKEVQLSSALKSYTDLSSFGLIKLAIKRAFGRK
jgi:hypothetical protein